MNSRTDAYPSPTPDQATSSQPILAMSGITRRYGAPPAEVTALLEVDFRVEKGEMVALVGASGSGKSTLLTIAGGLEQPTEGRVELEGRSLTEISLTALAEIRRRSIGFVFQDFNLLSGLTAAENVAAPLELDSMSTKAARPIALQRLQQVGLEDRADAFPNELSGGERQRVAIARALIGERRLLLADEPTGSLDSRTSDEILGLLRSACTPTTAVVIVTHDQEIAAQTDRIVTISDGRIIDERAGANR